jgi:ABC-type multidrug transport system fused ATPase/permease subunit
MAVSVIMPFISLATNFSLLHEKTYYHDAYVLFGFENDVNFIISFGVVLVCFYLTRSILNLLYFYLLSRFTQGRYHLLAYRLFKNYMAMPYKVFTTKNSSTLTKSIVNEAFFLTQLIYAVLLMMSEIFIVIFIYGIMLYVNYQVTFFLTIILILVGTLMVKTVSVQIKESGIMRASAQKQFYEIINRSFGNFKLIKLQSHEEEILHEFGEASYSYARANILNTTMAQVPRLFLEAVAFGLVIIIVVLLVWKYEHNISNMLAVISMFVLALYRLMPSINRIMSSYNQILFYHKSLDIVYDDLSCEREDPGEDALPFEKILELKQVSFEHNYKAVLKQIDLIIRKGDKIGFIGESGSGKSTLVDIIIGLYMPKEGVMLSDGVPIRENNIRSWRLKVGYIPQSIYLFDGTVGENVAFGLPYDKEKVDKVLKQAKIYDFLCSKEGKETIVGENGVMLSGGQKQRIAIARALYSNPEILVLDEATSALDDETEKEIMDEIYELSDDKTLIIIAHRLSTIDRCDEVYKLDGGKI